MRLCETLNHFLEKTRQILTFSLFSSNLNIIHIMTEDEEKYKLHSQKREDFILLKEICGDKFWKDTSEVSVEKVKSRLKRESSVMEKWEFSIPIRVVPRVNLSLVPC